MQQKLATQSHKLLTLICYLVVCSAPLNGQVDCGSGLVNTAFVGDSCTFSCDPGYLLQRNVTSGTCEDTGVWSEGLPSCVPLNCSEDNLPIPANTTVLQLPTCDITYQSQCTVSCDEGFTGDNVTYLCNVTSGPTMVDWMVLNSTEMNHMCQRGLFVAISNITRGILVTGSFHCVNSKTCVQIT